MMAPAFVSPAVAPAQPCAPPRSASSHAAAPAASLASAGAGAGSQRLLGGASATMALFLFGSKAVDKKRARARGINRGSRSTLSAVATLARDAATETTSKFSLEKYLVDMKTKVDEALEKSIVSECPEDKRFVEAMRYSLLAGGKRVRPVMCIAACTMARKRSGKDTAPGFYPDEETLKIAMPTAIALEMVHTMSLIHDDLPALDNDPLRRGKPTCHVKFGEDCAILAGDALLSESFAQIANHTPQDKVPATRIVEVVRRLAECVGRLGLAAGEMMDLEYEDKEATLDELRWIHLKKTAALLQCAVCAGAVLGGADLETDVRKLEAYSTNIGLAFQVQDDILDITASSEELGKTAGKDLEQDKTTYPKLMGLDGAKQEANRLFEEAIGSLESFGEHATPLTAIAKFIVSRGN
mmetsp:Transcript_24346/g.64206  ORF Transcript_24346/g.64206 Transcript_24346/m.64206 type:complete len:412 (-) Transcript_24346:277-1512(-)